MVSSSADGKTWSAVTRIPIDATTSTVDHFLPGIGADPATSGPSGHLTIVCYYYPDTNCSVSTCRLNIGFTTSTDGGATWTAGTKIGGPMKVSWLPVSDNGPMVADYIGVSYSNGNPFGVFAGALAPSGATLNEAMAESARGISPRAAHRSGRETLASSGSCHPKEGCRLPSRQGVPPVVR